MTATSASDSARAATSEKPLVLIDGVSKTYASRDGRDVAAVRDVTLALRRGEFVSLLGPSGCGKTTLLHMVAGLLKPTTGQVLVNGDARPAEAEEFGTVFQTPVLFPWRKVQRNVELPAEVLGLPKERYRKRANELLELVGLGGFGHKYPRELSGGMQQRASIARALIHDPGLLLMDEPFGAVDAITREQLNVELDRIRRVARKAVLFVTHSINEAVFLSDKVIVMGPRPTYIKDVVDIVLPHPRELEVMNTDEFAHLIAAVRNSLNS